MPRGRPPIPRAGAEAEPGSLYGLIGPYLEWLSVRNYSQNTLKNHEVALSLFAAFCEERGVTLPEEVTRALLERYQRYLYHLRQRDGRPLTFSTQHGRLVSLRVFFRWLTRQHVLSLNPASELVLPRLERRLPREVLTAKEAEHILGQVDVQNPLGLRDRAILEVFYSTGMRRMELLNLGLYDVDVEQGSVFIRLGKGKKDRLIPVGERACAFVRKYVEDVRPRLACGRESGHLFLTHKGLPFTTMQLTHVVRKYVGASGLGKMGACHLFRHTMATLMLENGADLRYIQHMLGHAQLSTTEVYTHVSIKKLKEVHARTHPAKAESHAGEDARKELEALEGTSFP